MQIVEHSLAAEAALPLVHFSRESGADDYEARAFEPDYFIDEFEESSFVFVTPKKLHLAREPRALRC
ncbi:hypothetical protein [Arthrobacter sp. S2(2024)]|uniref:hypothetical protein n=1 Tax=Arthrobacter sp. S2(2024) TaxID=3111911 RepID=UPI002FC9BFEF